MQINSLGNTHNKAAIKAESFTEGQTRAQVKLIVNLFMSQSHITAIPTLQTILSRYTGETNHLTTYKHDNLDIIRTGY